MQDLIQQDYTRLSGTFRMTSGVIDGKEVTDEVRRQTVLITDHDKFTVSDRGTAGTSGEGTFTIDPTKSPKTADSVQGTGPDKGKTLLGIYEIIDDNHKRACWAPVGKPRPTSFSSEPGSGHILQVWERVDQ
ncbi:MAG: TIGR03067 domain-containing protein [Chthoniobacterales bacterium]|nr:TIGR03067 domain-containing protein [Chthoniobacterales bacterium]